MIVNGPFLKKPRSFLFRSGVNSTDIERDACRYRVANELDINGTFGRGANSDHIFSG